MEKRRDQVDAGKIFERGRNYLLRQPYAAIARIIFIQRRQFASNSADAFLRQDRHLTPAAS